MRRPRSGLIVAALAAIALAGCGGDEQEREEQARDRTTTTRTTATTPQAEQEPAQEPTPGVSGSPGSGTAAPPPAGAGQQTTPSATAQPGAATGDPALQQTTPTDPTQTDPTQATTDPTQTTPGASAPPEPGVATPGVATGLEEGAIGTLDVAPAFVPFSANSPWNTPVDTAPVDSNSQRLIELAALRLGVVDVPGVTTVRTEFRRADTRLFVNTTRWATPVVDETGGAPVRIVCRQVICGPFAGVTSVTMPPDAAPDPRFDGWLTVINRGQGIAYDFWRARRVGDVMSYQYIKRWDLNGLGYSPPVSQDPALAVGARGSGLPLFAGLILPQELQAGRISHALAIAVPGPAQRNYVQPASVTDGIGRLNSLPEGARIRLRSDFEVDDERLPGGTNRRTTQAIIDALKRYGAIVVERAAVPTLYAQKNFNYGRLLFGNEVQQVALEDFEVIQLPPLYQDPPASTSYTSPNPGAAATGSGGGLGGTPGGSPDER